MTAFIYDYSSFTSRLHEIRNFCSKLAIFFRDTTVKVLDTHEGVMEVNLGRLLEDWNEECNTFPEFDVSTMLDIDPDGGIVIHNCGMLGVPGNISSCTLLHGIHVAIALESLRLGKVIGDDAFVVALRLLLARPSGYTTITMLEALSNLGDVAKEKVESWDEDEVDDVHTWHYTKRPIVRSSAERMYFGKAVVWPSIANAVDLDDGVHTHFQESLFTRRKKYATQVYRFLRTAEDLGEPSAEDKELVSVTLRSLHRALDIPWDGCTSGSGLFPYFIPSSQWDGDFCYQGLERALGTIMRIPVEYEKGLYDEVDLRRGSEFCHKSLPALTILVKLGYLERKVLTRNVDVSREYELVERFLKRDYGRYVYTYTVLDDCPVWSYALLDDAHVPHERKSDADNLISEIEREITYAWD